MRSMRGDQTWGCFFGQDPASINQSTSSSLAHGDDGHRWMECGVRAQEAEVPPAHVPGYGWRKIRMWWINWIASAALGTWRVMLMTSTDLVMSLSPSGSKSRQPLTVSIRGVVPRLALTVMWALTSIIGLGPKATTSWSTKTLMSRTSLMWRLIQSASRMQRQSSLSQRLASVVQL